MITRSFLLLYDSWGCSYKNKTFIGRQMKNWDHCKHGPIMVKLWACFSMFHVKFSLNTCEPIIEKVKWLWTHQKTRAVHLPFKNLIQKHTSDTYIRQSKLSFPITQNIISHICDSRIDEKEVWEKKCLELKFIENSCEFSPVKLLIMNYT